MIIESVLEINSFLLDGKRIYEVIFLDENSRKQVKRMDSIDCLKGKEWSNDN